MAITKNKPARREFWVGSEVKKEDRMAENRAEVVFLGTGTSVGVPALGCDCEVCTGGNPSNQRTRCSIVVRNSRGNLLVDTPPDLRTQLLREKIGVVHEVLFTHEHADHLFGLDDLRLFPFHLGHPVPLHCEPRVEKRIRHSFDYAFSERPATHPGATPKLEFRSIEPNCSFTVNDIQVLPIRLKHGPRFDVLGFRFGEFAYCTDVNEIPEASLPLLENLKVLVLGALRYRPHPTHFHLEAALEMIQKLKPKKAYLTHLSHDFDHEKVNAELPDGVSLAYDGLRLTFKTS